MRPWVFHGDVLIRLLLCPTCCMYGYACLHKTAESSLGGLWLGCQASMCSPGGSDAQNLILVELLCRFQEQVQQDAKK